MQYYFSVLLTALSVITSAFHHGPPSLRLSFPLRHNIASNQSLDAMSCYEQAAQVRAQHGHDAAIYHYRQLLLHNPHDTSAAVRIAAADDTMKILARVGWPYSRSNQHSLTQSTGYDWEEDIEKLNNFLKMSNYRHSSLREHVFHLPTGRMHDYPMGPIYARPLHAGECFDVSIAMGKCGSDEGWLRSLRCLAALFLLSISVPRKVFTESMLGGEDTLELMLRLGIVFLFDERKQLNVVPMEKTQLDDDEWVVPLVHLFPIEIPILQLSGVKPASNDIEERKSIVLMTDLHPSVLGMTSIDHVEKIQYANATKNSTRDGAVMYIGPDSLALVHHLHASLMHFIDNSTTLPQSFKRVLDVCTGSGVQAMAALAMLDSQTNNLVRASAAVAVDINERALRFTTFNAHLNGYNDRIRTVHADILSRGGELDGSSSSLVSMLLEDLTEYEQNYVSQNERCNEELKFDVFLANPPFIPVPPSRLDYAASSMQEVSSDGINDIHSSSSRYGLFSSGGASGEDCLRAVVSMAPVLLKSAGGLMAVVSEFMNPPPRSYLSTQSAEVDDAKAELVSRVKEWWGQQSIDGSFASGILFTNENAVTTDIYAERRAVKNDMEDRGVWQDHLSKSGIHSISPGLLFVQRSSHSSQRTAEKKLEVRHHHVPKTKNGSIWTPHNVEAVEYTRQQLMDWFR